MTQTKDTLQEVQTDQIVANTKFHAIDKKIKRLKSDEEASTSKVDTLPTHNHSQIVVRWCIGSNSRAEVDSDECVQMGKYREISFQFETKAKKMGEQATEQAARFKMLKEKHRVSLNDPAQS